MLKKSFNKIKKYVLKHTSFQNDRDHINRVLFNALQISEYERNVDSNVLIAAVLLHDIGRTKEDADYSISHAKAGAKIAYRYLIKNGWSEEMAAHVRACIRTHSRKGRPKSIEAKILYDADKLDYSGVTGFARAAGIYYEADLPLYSMFDFSEEDITGNCEEKSLIMEYNKRVANNAARMFTTRGRELAEARQESVNRIATSMIMEGMQTYKEGACLLKAVLK